MPRIDLELPEAARIVHHALYSEKDPEHLVQEQLSVALPGGIVIDVMWSPEFDVSGAFVVNVFRDGWQDKVRRPFTTTDPYAAAREVECIAQECLSGALGGPAEVQRAKLQ